MCGVRLYFLLVCPGIPPRHLVRSLVTVSLEVELGLAFPLFGESQAQIVFQLLGLEQHRELLMQYEMVQESARLTQERRAIHDTYLAIAQAKKHLGLPE